MSALLGQAPSAAGIAVQTVQTFIGNITNAKGGTISAGRTGIVVNEHVNQFVGNIVNMGAITAVSGIVVGCGCGVSTFAGSISNNGTITAAAVLSVTSKLTPFLAVTLAERILAASSTGGAPGTSGWSSGTSGATAEVHVGSMLSLPGLTVRFVAFAGNAQVPESQPAEIE